VDLLPTVVAATRLEARAVRRALPTATVLWSGVGLSRLSVPTVLNGPVVTCGIAGSLRRDVRAGTVVIPGCVLAPDGRTIECDRELVSALTGAALRMGLSVESRPMLTTRRLVTGAERLALAEGGCVAADMETGFLDAPALASVRVVLDTPDRELSPVWAHPWRALWQPVAWTELPWLLRDGPRCARLAARVLAAAFVPQRP
jgi:hypothetical protein